jgi:hypothetical protein
MNHTIHIILLLLLSQVTALTSLYSSYMISSASVADPDPGSGAFLPPGSGIRDGAMVGSGSGIRDKQTKFVNSLYTKIGRIRDPVLLYPSDPGSGSGMEQWSDPDPG